MNSENYRDQLLSLLPPGKAITKEPASGIGRMMHGLGAEAERVEDRAHELIEESVPGNCDELLAEWEEDFGIIPTGTTAERKIVLATKVVDIGQQYPTAFSDIITAFGFTSTIYEFRPAWVSTMVAGDACGDQDILFYWLVDVLDAGTTVDGMKAMMKEISRLKPGHTQVFFDYPDSEIAPDSITVSPNLVSGIINSEIIAVEAGEIVYRTTNLEYESSSVDTGDDEIYDVYIFPPDPSVADDQFNGMTVYSQQGNVYSEIVDTVNNGPSGVYAYAVAVLPAGFTGKTVKIYSVPATFVAKSGNDANSGLTPWSPKLTIQAAIDAAVAAGATHVQILDSGAYDERIVPGSTIIEFAADETPTITAYTTDTKIIYNVKCANAVTENQFAGMIFYGTSLDGDNLRLVIESNTAASADSYFDITFTTFIDSPVDNAKDMSVNTLIFRSNVNRGVSGEDEIQIFDFETGKEVNELAGYTFIQDVKEYVEAYPDPTAGGFGTVGTKLIAGCIASRTITKNEFAGMRISGICGDGVTPFSYTIVSNTIDSGGQFSVTLLETKFSVTLLETITDTIDDNGFLIEELKTTGKTEYTITGNSFVGTGYFSFAFSSGFFRLGGYFLDGFSSGFKKH